MRHRKIHTQSTAAVDAVDSIMAVIRALGFFFIPLILILPHFAGLFGVQISRTISDVLSFSLAVPMGLSVFNERKASSQTTDDQTS